MLRESGPSSVESPLPWQNLSADRNTTVPSSPSEAVNASHPGRPAAQPSELTSEDLRAPVSAFNNMSRHQDSVRRQPKTPTSTGCDPDQQSILSLGLLFGRDTKREDMVSRGIISERLARQLFNKLRIHSHPSKPACTLTDMVVAS